METDVQVLVNTFLEILLKVMPEMGASEQKLMLAH